MDTGDKMKQITIILAIIILFVLNENGSASIIIPNDAIRVRVIANSNEKSDIEVKETLKKDIQPTIYNLLKNTTSIEEAREIIEKNIPNIDVEIQKSLKRQNYSKKYEINYGLNYFPEKTFKGIVYEEGYYESLVITLGEGKGENWWCVLFPPLCILEFDEIEKDDIEYQTFVGEILNKYI